MPLFLLYLSKDNLNLKTKNTIQKDPKPVDSTRKFYVSEMGLLLSLKLKSKKMEVYNNEYLTLTLRGNNKKTLELGWKPSTKNMTATDFKAGIYLFACLAMEHDVDNLLVLIYDFGYEGAMSEELTAWRDKNIFPKYNQAGVKKFAFLGNQDQIPPQDPPQSPHADFPTRFFANKKDMMQWLNSSGKPVF